MADAVIGAIRVILGADTAAFSEGLRKANKDLDSFAAGFAKTAAVAAAAMAAAGLAIGIAVKKTLNQADELGKMAQKFGVPIEQLSALKFAAELSDVSIESLGRGLGKLSKSLTEAAAKPTSEAANAFRALGVSVRNADGSVKTSEQTLLDVADSFAGLKDGAGKTAVAIQLFGRSGADLIPLLNQGRSGIQGLKDEAKALGVVIDGPTAKAAEEFNDNLKRLDAVWRGVTTNLAAGAAGPLADVSKTLVEISKNANVAQTAGEFLGQAFKALIEGAILAAEHFRGLGSDIAAVWNFIKQTPVIGLTAAWAQMTEQLAKSRQDLFLLAVSFREINHETNDLVAGLAAVSKAAENATKPQRDFNFAALGGKNAIDSYVDSVKKSIATQQAEAQTIGLGIGAKEKLKTVLEGIQIAQNNSIPVTEALRQRLQALGEQASLSAQQLAAAQIIQAAIPEWEQLAIKINTIIELMGKVPEKAEQLKNALIQTQLSVQNLILTATATALGQFGQLFTAFGAHNKKLFEVGKAFATAEAIVNTYKAANQALTAPPGPPFSYVYVAAAIAAGLANVLKIQSTKFTGAAMGGSFKVPGGSTSVDTKLVPLMLSPGERVDITPSSRASDSGGSRELVIPSIKPRDFFTGETVREMILAIDQWHRDGGQTIRVAQ